MERELAEERLRKQEEDDQSGWNIVEIDQTPVDLSNVSLLKQWTLYVKQVQLY